MKGVNGVTFNGIHNSTIDGLVYVSSSRFMLPENKDEYIDIPYSDKSILIPDNSKRDIQIPVNFTLVAKNRVDLFEKFIQIAGWLDVPDKAPLIFDDVPNYYYNGKPISNVVFEEVAEFEEIAEFTVTFRCDPYPKVVGT